MGFKPLPRKFYERHTLEVAPDLLGMRLVRRLSGVELVGTIVEVEAYRGTNDPASHAYRGPTPRSRIMWGPPGIAYVYFTYGNHHCLNAVTEPEGSPAAVLIRAVRPLKGVEVMARNRGVQEPHLLASGPGRLTQAFAITLEQNGCDLTQEGELFIAEGEPVERSLIATSPRVGVKAAKDWPWRFYIRGDRYVSRGPKTR
jgi:DNA-3-methyladenine glycosylase